MSRVDGSADEYDASWTMRGREAIERLSTRVAVTSRVTVHAIVIGSQATDHLAIEVLSRAYPDAEDYWDGNWLSVTVRMQAGAFRGEYQAMVRADELAQLREGLANLHAVLQGTATLESREGVLAMRVEGDGHGHFVADCTARDQPGIGNTLQFALRFDQTDLPPVLASLDAVLARFPVTGCRTG